MRPHQTSSYLDIFVKTCYGILIAPLFYIIFINVLRFSDSDILLECISFTLLSIAIIGPFILFQYKLPKVLSLGTIYFLAFVKLSFQMHYGSNLDSSALYVFFETNMEETVDYLFYYFKPSVLALLAIIILLYYFNLKYLITLNFIVSKRTLYSSLGILLLPIVSSHFILYNYAPNRSIIYGIPGDYKLYKRVRSLLQKELSSSESKNISLRSFKDTPETHVVIIGESTSRGHMQLYGYNRKTTPLLKEIDDELTIFRDVIVPNVHTIISLEKILTFSNNRNQNREKNTSIVQLANQAEYKTYWISNQKAIGIHESLASIISTSADEKAFITKLNLKTRFDTELIPYIKEAIEDQSTDKKVIFIHLMGTHTSYDKRYPKDFEYYKDPNPLSKFQHQKAIEIVNHYDNAILYNDYFIRQVIETVRETQSSSTVTYFSDHGDEVYDTLDLYGHDAYHGSKSMFEIPFIIWCSEKYNITNPNSSTWKNNITKKYILEDYIHTFSNMLQLEYDEYEPTKSILNDNFKEKNRVIKNGIDYETK